MSNTPPINPTHARPADAINRVGSEEHIHRASRNGDARARSSDQLELSNRAVLLSKLRDLPAIREDLVQRVRDQLDAEAYETPEKIDAAADAVARELDAIG